jgi:hypothetical protein
MEEEKTPPEPIKIFDCTDRDFDTFYEKIKDLKTTRDDIGEYLANGSYGIVTQTKDSVFKILMNFIGKSKEDIESFIREIFITNLLFCLENERLGPGPSIPNPFVSVKSVYKFTDTAKIMKLKDNLRKNQQKTFDTKSPVIGYEMDHAGVSMFDFLKYKHDEEYKCECGNILECDTYTNLEIAFIIKLAKLIDYLQEKYQFVHGDLSSGNVMVKDGNIMLIDVGNAFVTIKINKEEIIEMKCDTCLYPATRFNDRRDLFRFLLDLGFPNSKISIKLNEFIRSLITEEDAKQFKLKDKKATEEFLYVLYKDKKYFKSSAL